MVLSLHGGHVLSADPLQLDVEVRFEVLRAGGAEQPLLLEVEVDGCQLVEVDLVVLVLSSHQVVRQERGERCGGWWGTAAVSAGRGAEAGPGHVLRGHHVSSHLK